LFAHPVDVAVQGHWLSSFPKNALENTLGHNRKPRLPARAAFATGIVTRVETNRSVW
jgi:hypothetical protein